MPSIATKDTIASPIQPQGRRPLRALLIAGSQRREVPDTLWRCTRFGARKPYACDQIEDMMQEKEGMTVFADWVASFVAHVEKKGVVPGTGETGRSAQTTTNQDKKKI